jgi:uncharacterized protein (UPF0332 family)
MKPDDFLALAIRLSSSSAEAERRSAVSRAYYGTFHWARELIDSCGVTLPASDHIHSTLVRCLQHSGDPRLETAGRKLDSLRSERNQADYNLADRRFTNATFVQIQITSARQIADAISNAIADTAAIRFYVREYARDVLKLSVREHD